MSMLLLGGTSTQVCLCEVHRLPSGEPGTKVGLLKFAMLDAMCSQRLEQISMRGEQGAGAALELVEFGAKAVTVIGKELLEIRWSDPSVSVDAEPELPVKLQLEGGGLGKIAFDTAAGARAAGRQGETLGSAPGEDDRQLMLELKGPALVDCGAAGRGSAVTRDLHPAHRSRAQKYSNNGLPAFVDLQSCVHSLRVRADTLRSAPGYAGAGPTAAPAPLPREWPRNYSGGIIASGCVRSIGMS
ncbi:hypothetical protein GCM10011415_11390 [Salipiger pallidus]|uniref:Uncharacterized protein n=1 Tax=Salipiger pallidus TaxID=1775170 RepID=A0A8J2ZIA3_9RHOB|nr:hypothetical protein GCM10011415_11390 [Salipiger pallidus]